MTEERGKYLVSLLRYARPIAERASDGSSEAARGLPQRVVKRGHFRDGCMNAKAPCSRGCNAKAARNTAGTIRTVSGHFESLHGSKYLL